MLATNDKNVFTTNGFVVAFLFAAIFFAAIMIHDAAAIAVGFVLLLLATGFTIVYPNDAKVVTFFGKYVGTIRGSGFLYTIPLSSRFTVSLKFINFNTEQLKVNDLKGNPIEIGAVVVWWVKDAAQAVFNVDNYREFVANQSEIAVRSIAAQYPYDSEGDVQTLRGNTQELSDKLIRELQDRLENIGVVIEEARISHLAYAQEIAQSMLKRQQAEAVLMARKYLIENALFIVDDVLKHFEQTKQINISDEQKMQVINNLLVTFTSEKETSPVLKVG